MTHQKRIDHLKSILSDVFDYALNETSFRSPDVLEGMLAAYIDVSERIRFIAFRFPDLEDEMLSERLYGLGLHLENEGLSNVSMNPSYAALAKLGEGLQESFQSSRPKTGLPTQAKQALRLAAKTAAQRLSLSEDIQKFYADRVEEIDHVWVMQALDAWEIENDRRKLHCADVDSCEIRAKELSVCYQHESMISELRKEADSFGDLRLYLDEGYQPVYDAQGHQSKLAYPEDIKSTFEGLKNPLVDKVRALTMVDQVLLENQLSFRGIKPGDKPASELMPLRELLMGRRVFKEDADVDALIKRADKVAREHLKGKSDFFHQEYERSLAETRSALAYLTRKPVLEKADSMTAFSK